MRKAWRGGHGKGLSMELFQLVPTKNLEHQGQRVESIMISQGDSYLNTSDVL